MTSCLLFFNLLPWRGSRPLHVLKESSIRCSRLVHQYATAQQSFEELGLRRPVIAALQEAFPNVIRPTPAQASFIPALLSGKDILLKGQTGSGKSFGLLLALLSLPRKFNRVELDGKYVKSSTTTSLFIVPHRDLALQLMHWTASIYASILQTGGIDSVAQLVLRGINPIPAQVDNIHNCSPHVLIGTPQAVLEALQLESNPLKLPHLSTIVVDEADYLIQYTPRAPDKYKRDKFELDLKRHPSVTRQILDMVYSPMRQAFNKKKEIKQAQEIERPLKPMVLHRPQLIMTSATLKSQFRYSVLTEGGWFRRAEDKVTIVTGSPSEVEDTTNSVMGGGSLVHSALIVSNDGTVRNIPGAVDLPTGTAETETTQGEADQPVATEIPPPSSEDFDNFADTASPFNQNALEAVATVFALDVPRVALLVLKAAAPVRRAIFDLRSLGINAHGLDVLEPESGGSFLLQRGVAPEDNPTLLVSTLATTRGLDLPDLTHVFLLGAPAGLTPDEYMHVAGRTGRFGKDGTVIAVLEEPRMVKDNTGKTYNQNEPRWIQNIYTKIGVTPRMVAHFGNE